VYNVIYGFSQLVSKHIGVQYRETSHEEPVRTVMGAGTGRKCKGVGTPRHFI